MTMTLTDSHPPAYPDEAAPPSMHCMGMPAPAWVNAPQWRLATVGMRLGEMDVVPGDIAAYHAPAGWICRPDPRTGRGVRSLQRRSQTHMAERARGGHRLARP